MRTLPIPVVSDKYLPDESFLAKYSATTVEMLYNALNKTRLPNRIETLEDIAKRYFRNNHGSVTRNISRHYWPYEYFELNMCLQLAGTTARTTPSSSPKVVPSFSRVTPARPSHLPKCHPLRLPQLPVFFILLFARTDFKPFNARLVPKLAVSTAF
jgi:hypothetical protein